MKKSVLDLLSIPSTLFLVDYIHSSLPYTLFLVGLATRCPSRRGEGRREENEVVILISRPPSCRISWERLYLSTLTADPLRKAALQFSSLPASSGVSLLLTPGLRMVHLTVTSSGLLCSPVPTILTCVLMEPTLSDLILAWCFFSIGTVTNIIRQLDLGARICIGRNKTVSEEIM